MFFRSEEWAMHHIDILFFKDVSNAAALRLRAKSGKLQCCLLAPAHLTDAFQILAAFHVAVSRLETSSLTTSSVHTEIMRHLGADKNIGRALGRVGPLDTSTELVVAVVDAARSTMHSIRSEVEGVEVEDVESAIAHASSEQAIVKSYNLCQEEANVSNLRDAVLTAAAVSLL